MVIISETTISACNASPFSGTSWYYFYCLDTMWSFNGIRYLYTIIYYFNFWVEVQKNVDTNYPPYGSLKLDISSSQINHWS